jgi:hypothetical protein
MPADRRRFETIGPRREPKNGSTMRKSARKRRVLHRVPRSAAEQLEGSATAYFRPLASGMRRHRIPGSRLRFACAGTSLIPVGPRAPQSCARPTPPCLSTTVRAIHRSRRVVHRGGLTPYLPCAATWLPWVATGCESACLSRLRGPSICDRLPLVAPAWLH